MEQSRRRPLQVGLVLPVVEYNMAGATPRWADIAAIARRAEEVGFDSLWVPDHLLYRFAGQQRTQGWWECWSLLAALAAITERVALAPLVTATSFRNPALLAKMADTVDEISGGRLILALGAGYHEPEYQAFGFPFDHRVGRFEEALTIIHGLLREGQVDFEGKYYQARECELRPRGPRAEGPPILIGSTSPRMLRLVARYADAWNTWLVWKRSYADAIPPLRAVVDAACVEAGRDPATLARTVALRVDLPSRPGRSASGAEPISGSLEEIAAALRAFEGEGISHLQVTLVPFTLAAVDEFAPVLEMLR